MGDLWLSRVSLALAHAALRSTTKLSWHSWSNCNRAPTVSLLARRVPKRPYAMARAIVLHLPAGFMPVQASASRSKATILELLRPEA